MRLVVHCQRDPYDVYVGRPMPRFKLKGSKWANPNRDWTADDYERHLLASPDLMAQIGELRGQVLGCWCAPAGGYEIRRPFTCHAQVLAYYANRSPRKGRTDMKVKIIPNDRNNPPGKLADAELHFGADRYGAKDGEPLEGLKLIGFAIWERRVGGGRNVTFPARTYSVNGDRRSFALLRPNGDDASGQDRVRELILQAYAEWEDGQQPDPAADVLRT